MKPLIEYRLVIFDLDGTVYNGDEAIPGAVEVIQQLQHNNVRVVFLTNNSAKSSKRIYDKIKSLGIQCLEEDVWTSGKAAGEYLLQIKAKKVFVTGTDELRRDIEKLGIQVVKPDEASCLIIGFNPKATYKDCSDAVTAALHATLILACNKEKVYPEKNGKLVPGCGAMVAAVEWCSNKKVDKIIGKPNVDLLKTIMKHYAVTEKETLMVGDSIESDIEMAHNCKIDSILVGEDQQLGAIKIKNLYQSVL